MAEFTSLIGKTPSQTKVAILPNAKDYYSNHVRNLKAAEILTYFLEKGFNPEIVDLLDYNSPTDLYRRLGVFDVIWANGGNTFCLRYEMKRSGFEHIIRDLLDKGIVYAGESAGAIVAGSSLDSIETADNPEYSEGVIWEGLNLTNTYILPHVGNPAFEEANQIARSKHSDEPGYIELTDNQACVVNSDHYRIVDADE